MSIFLGFRNFPQIEFENVMFFITYRYQSCLKVPKKSAILAST
ncbi:hypothetical protein BpHYR1_033421 [Brachionus plicatilis]|uniref:Uncharacterized protein n=1 Tax=Brachionus plicatilis TaxID=10195 RepID=A0A3M7PEK7_BRAPC|nr:hypothetical protein BpHYR1_033421 [Brachionus plicatilis]